ncbi:MAG: hypothetical protein WA453_10015 [Methyloceanibacter sp.]
MTGSKPFHQFLQETLSPYGFLAERHLNASFSNAVGLKAMGLGNASRRHHLLGSGLERQTVWSNHHAGQVLPARCAIKSFATRDEWRLSFLSLHTTRRFRSL